MSTTLTAPIDKPAPTKTVVDPFTARMREGVREFDKTGKEPPVKAAEKPVEQAKPVETTPTPAAQEKPAEASPAPKESGLNDAFKHLLAKPEEKAVETPAKAAPSKEENLANLRKALEEKDALLQELKSKVGQPPEDYAKLKSDFDEASKILERVKLEASPRFRAKYDNKLEESKAAIKKAIANSTSDINVQEAIEALDMPEGKARNAKLSEILEGLDGLPKNKVVTAIGEFDRIREEREAELGTAKQSLIKEMEYEKQQGEQLQAQASKILEDTIGAASQSPALNWLFNKVEGNEAWNQKIEASDRAAREFWTAPKSQQELSQVTILGAKFPVLFEAFVAVKGEYDKLNKEVAELRGATPKVQAGTSTHTPKAGGKDPFMDKLRSKINA